GKLISTQQLSSSGGRIETEKITVRIPQQAQSSEVAIYEQPVEALQQEHPQAFVAETPLGSAFEIQNPGHNLNIQGTPLQVELNVDSSKIPTIQRNTANTYAQ